MEGYAYSYPDSGDSSPRSREIDFENPPPSWADDNNSSSHQAQPQAQTQAHKVKFMVSYGGKIQPRSHDNQLAYIGGETKILAVDRSLKFNSLLNKLSSLIAEDHSQFSLSSFKYQLPGEELDALISVTNDDDLEHMMHEYDRLFRASSKPARLRLFAFPNTHNQQQSGFGSGSSEPGKLDRERFVEALNSVPVPVPPPPVVIPDVPVHPNPNLIHHNNVDFLFGLDNNINKGQVPVHHVVQDRVIGSDSQIDARIQELNRLQISAQTQQQQDHIYRGKSEDINNHNNNNNNFVGGFSGGEVYQKPPPTIPASVQIPASYWQQQPPQQQPPVMSLEQQQHHQQQFQQQQPLVQQHQQQQPVYMFHHAPPQPASVYHAPPQIRPVSTQPPPPQQQQYYQMQRVPQGEQIYREQQVQPVYSGPPASSIPAPVKMTGYSDGGVQVRPVTGNIPTENNNNNINSNSGGGGYAQVAYDSATGRQVYYATPGGVSAGGVVTAPFQGQVAANLGAVSGEMIRPGLTNNNNNNNVIEGKVVNNNKVLPTSAAV